MISIIPQHLHTSLPEIIREEIKTNILKLTWILNQCNRSLGCSREGSVRGALQTLALQWMARKILMGTVWGQFVTLIIILRHQLNLCPSPVLAQFSGRLSPRREAASALFALTLRRFQPPLGSFRRFVFAQPCLFSA